MARRQDKAVAAAAIPPLSATFRDVSDSRHTLPIFDPPTCDGHARLWTSCPDGSIAPLVISARTLIDAPVVTDISDRLKDLWRRIDRVIRFEATGAGVVVDATDPEAIAAAIPMPEATSSTPRA